MNYYIWVTFILVCILIFSGMMNKQVMAESVGTCNKIQELSPAEIRSDIKPKLKPKTFAKKLGGDSNDCTMGEPECVGDTCTVKRNCVGDTCTVKRQRPDNLEVY